jgi:GTP-binding protein
MKKNKQQNNGLVAIVGRANVGKSTLFNKIIGHRKSIVTDIAGTTRDKVLAKANWLGNEFWLVDTAGIFGEKESKEIIESVEKQIAESVDEASIVLWVVDGSKELSSEDEKIIRRLRKNFNKVALVINKSDKKDVLKNQWKFEKYGLKNIFIVSAINGVGIGDLLDYVVNNLPEKNSGEDEDNNEIVKVCIMGRPNVGKSSLTNQICGVEKRVVSTVAGTTRDVGEVKIDFKSRPVLLYDTAGVCRNSRQYADTIARYSIMRSISALKKSEVAIMIIDGVEGLTKRDLAIIGMITEVYKGLVLYVNKWDLAEENGLDQDQFLDDLRYKLKYIYWLPVVFGSAKTGLNIKHLLKQVLTVADNGRRQIAKADWDDFIMNLKETNERINIFGLTSIEQIGIMPMKLKIRKKSKRAFLPNDEKNITNIIRDYFSLYGAQIVIETKK